MIFHFEIAFVDAIQFMYNLRIRFPHKVQTPTLLCSTCGDRTSGCGPTDIRVYVNYWTTLCTLFLTCEFALCFLFTIWPMHTDRHNERVHIMNVRGSSILLCVLGFELITHLLSTLKKKKVVFHLN